MSPSIFDLPHDEREPCMESWALRVQECLRTDDVDNAVGHKCHGCCHSLLSEAANIRTNDRHDNVVVGSGECNHSDTCKPTLLVLFFCWCDIQDSTTNNRKACSKCSKWLLIISKLPNISRREGDEEDDCDLQSEFG